jgi:autotransporter-associated beta strand protein/T5SS/PEP-CTERM-associated repeat protein
MFMRRTCKALAVVLALTPVAPAQTWNGSTASQDWGTPGNWTPATVPNSATAAAILPTLGGPAPDYLINNGSSVQVQSLSFTNTTGNYSITGPSFSSMQSITVGSGVTTGNTIGSSISFVGGSTPLTITNNAALGSSPTLTLGAISTPNTSITQGSNGVNVSGTGFTSITGNVTGVALGTLTKSGSGQLNLTGTNAFGTGPGGSCVVLNGGTLAFNGESALGPSGPNMVLNVNSATSGGLEFLNGGITINRQVSLASSTRIICNGTDSNTIVNIMTPVGNSATLVKDGTGTLTLPSTGGNTQTANTINGGTLAIYADASLGVAGNPVTFNGGTLEFVINVSLSSTRAVVLNSTGGTIQVDASQIGTVNGPISGSGALTKTGSGMLQLAGQNTFTGGLTVQQGTLILASAVANGLPVTLGGGTNSGTFDLNTQSTQISSLTTSGTGTANTITNGNTPVATLTIANGANGSFGGLVSGNILLAESGPGTLTLANTTNSYNGGTKLNGGTLAVAANGALGASSGGLTFAGGTLEATSSFSTARAVTINGSGTFSVDSGATLSVSSPLAGSGTLAKTGTGTLSLTGAGSSVNVLNVNAGSLAFGGGSLTLTSNANNTIYLNVGGGSATALTVSGGAVVSSTGAGSNAGVAIDAGAVVTGTGSQLKSVDELAVGNTTVGSLTVQNSGFCGVPSSFLVAGNWTGSSGAVFVETGGTVTTAVTLIGSGTSATGSLNVAGAGSQLAALYYVSIGEGGSGTAVVQSAGAVTSQITTVANNPGSTGSVTVTDPGSTWTNSTNTYFGGNGASPPAPGGTATLTVANGGSYVTGGTFYILRSDGTINVNGGTLSVGSFSVASGVTPNLTLSDGTAGPALTIGIDNSSSTWSFPFADGPAGPATINKTGTGTLTLTGHLTNTGGYMASQGIIDFNGALVQPGTGTLAAAAGATMQYDNGARVFGGFLAGPGTHIVNGATFTGVTSFNSATISVTGPASFINFNNGGALNVAAGLASTPVLTRFTNQGSGSITMGAASAVNVADFQSYGTLTLNPATVGSGQFTLLTNTGSSPMYFNGGSRTFLGTPATANSGGSPTFVAGIDLNGKNAVVAGGLFVNNGYVVDSSNGGAGTATIVADYGSLVKGAGFFQNPVITQNGGRVQAGNSPGSASFGRFVFGPGGVSNYVFAIDDATGQAGPSPDAAGHVSGWGFVKASRQSVGSTTTSGNFTWTATPTDKLTVAIDTLINPTTVGTDVAGPMADFDPMRAYSWSAAHWAGTYAGPTDVAALNASTTFDTSGFQNPVAGTFGWSLDSAGQSLSLTYTPTGVPEPGTLALTGTVLAIGWVRFWRRRWVSTTSEVGPA